MVVDIWSPFVERQLPSLIDRLARDDRVMCSATHKGDAADMLNDWTMDIFTTSHNLHLPQFWHNQPHNITHWIP